MLGQEKAKNDRLQNMLAEAILKRTEKAKKQLERQAKRESMQRILGSKVASDATSVKKEQHTSSPGALTMNSDLANVVGAR